MEFGGRSSYKGKGKGKGKGNETDVRCFCALPAEK